MSSTVQGTKQREETLVWFTCTGSLGAPQNVPVVVTGVGMETGQHVPCNTRSCGWGGKAGPEAKGSHKEQSDQTGGSLKAG